MPRSVEVIANHNQQQILTGMPCGVVVEYDTQSIVSTKTYMDILESRTPLPLQQMVLSADHVMFS